jgi:histidinol phosphatase-like PHP family hydrolase
MCTAAPKGSAWSPGRPSPPLPYDAHVHTTNSDGRNSLQECVRAAEACGLRALAITDHYFPSGAAVDKWVRAIAQADAGSCVTVVPGVEAVVLNCDGELSLRPSEARLVRWVLAELSYHTEGIGHDAPASLEGFLANVERCLCAAAASPLVDALAHPFNLGRFAARVNPEDLPRPMLQRIARAMVENDCAYELMNQAYWWHPDLGVGEYVEQIIPVLRLFAEMGVTFTVGSDAHSVCGVGNLVFAHYLMEAAGIGREALVDLEALNERRRWEQAHGRRLP